MIKDQQAKETVSSSVKRISALRKASSFLIWVDRIRAMLLHQYISFISLPTKSNVLISRTSFYFILIFKIMFFEISARRVGAAFEKRPGIV